MRRGRHSRRRWWHPRNRPRITRAELEAKAAELLELDEARAVALELDYWLSRARKGPGATGTPGPSNHAIDA